MRKYWTDADDEKLKELAPTHTRFQLAEILDRTPKAVRHRAGHLGVTCADGRAAPETKEKRSIAASQREVAKGRTPEPEFPGQAKVCNGTLHNNEVLPIVDFAWNRSGLTRRPVCDKCDRFDRAERQRVRINESRPKDWTPKSVPRHDWLDCRDGKHECTGCGRRLKLEKFPLNKETPCGYNPRCKVCIDSARITRVFGLSSEEVVWLLEYSNEVCGLCGLSAEEASEGGISRRLDIDHDHFCCGKGSGCKQCIRGMLCNLCNTAVGRIEKRPLMAARFEDYLTRRPFLTDEFKLWQGSQ